MNCQSPYVKDGHAFGCGQCMPCRVNKRRQWTHRLLLEATQHVETSFVTLTYDEDHLPDDNAVSRRAIQLFLKRLRKTSETRIRYFAVGEYGDVTARPHYHLALYGFPRCHAGRTRYDKAGAVKCCKSCHSISRAWGQGRIQSAFLEPESMAYVCGYTVKKLTSPSDPRLEGRAPEFATMSRRPGLGHDAMHDVAHVLMKHGADQTLIDVPGELRHGRRKMPLDRYLKRKLRKMIGRDEATPQEAMDKIKEEMYALREGAFLASKSIQETVAEKGKAKAIQIEARQRRQRKKHL